MIKYQFWMELRQWNFGFQCSFENTLFQWFWISEKPKNQNSFYPYFYESDGNSEGNLQTAQIQRKPDCFLQPKKSEKKQQKQLNVQNFSIQVTNLPRTRPRMRRDERKNPSDSNGTPQKVNFSDLLKHSLVFFICLISSFWLSQRALHVGITFTML